MGSSIAKSLALYFILTYAHLRRVLHASRLSCRLHAHLVNVHYNRLLAWYYTHTGKTGDVTTANILSAAFLDKNGEYIGDVSESLLYVTRTLRRERIDIATIKALCAVADKHDGADRLQVVMFEENEIITARFNL